MVSSLPKSKRLQHQRYKDGREKSITYTPPKPLSYKVRSNGRAVPLPVDDMRQALSDRPGLLSLLNQRVRSLESIIAMDFDSSALHVFPLYIRKARNGSRYLNEVSPCYCYVTLKELHASGGFRAANGEVATLGIPMYLTRMHAESMRTWLFFQFSQIANVEVGRNGRWHDLWVPDVLSHLMNQAMVDFSEQHFSEFGIQFVLDAQRTLICCCESPSKFPNMLPLMRKYLLDFIQHPELRGRDRVPDLGDLLQWLVVEILDRSITWKDDLVHAVIVELMRRGARWVAKHMTKQFGLKPKMVRRQLAGEYKLVPHRRKPGRLFKVPSYHYSRETRAEMLLRCAKQLTKRELLDTWWSSMKVGGRVVLYSHTFYNHLFGGKTLQEFKDKYDPVLGAAHPGDHSIKSARGRIESVSNLSDMFDMLGYSTSDDSIWKLCVWSLEAEEGYDKVGRSDPLEGGWKSTSPKKRQMIPGESYIEGSPRGSVATENPFDALGDEAGQGAGKEPGREASKEAGQESGKGAGKEAGKEVGQGQRKERVVYLSELIRMQSSRRRGY